MGTYRLRDYMQVYKSIIQSLKFCPGSSGIKRGALVIVLCSLLCLMGTVTYFADASTLNAAPTVYSHVSKSTTAIQSSSANGQASRRYHHPAYPQTQQRTQNPLDYPVFYGNLHLPEIALTFDDGPNPIYTSQILAILQAHKIKATFFDVGYLVQDFPNIVRQEFLQGNSIGNHSWSHPQLTRLSAAGILSQLKSTSNAIQSVTGVRPTVFRPPYGSFNPYVVAQAFQQNLSTILWNNDARDWATPGVNVIVNRVLNEVHDGGIILLHDGGGYRYQTVTALPIIISTLQQWGYRFVTVPQLLQDIPSTNELTPLPTPPSTDASNFSTFLAPALIAWKQE